MHDLNPIALRKAKIVCDFGLPECNRVNSSVEVHWVMKLVRGNH